MWNSTLHALLKKVIAGMDKVVLSPSYSGELNSLLKNNLSCHDHSKVLDLSCPMSIEQIALINGACKFLFHEFAFQFPDLAHAVSGFAGCRPTLLHKVSLWPYAMTPPPTALVEACREHKQIIDPIFQRELDCLFITAMPLEFCAVARRLNGFTKGLQPEAARGFMESDEKPPGWVKGCVTDGKRTAKVMVICGSRYGPIHASTAVKEAMSMRKPRYVVVVGIAASLDDGKKLALGDIGYSSKVVDITLGKDELDRSVVTTVKITLPPDQSKIPDNLKDFVRCSPSGDCTFTGVLSEKDAQKLKLAWKSVGDRAAIESLVKSTRAAAEKTDLKWVQLP